MLKVQALGFRLFLGAGHKRRARGVARLRASTPKDPGYSPQPVTVYNKATIIYPQYILLYIYTHNLTVTVWGQYLRKTLKHGLGFRACLEDFNTKDKSLNPNL